MRDIKQSVIIRSEFVSLLSNLEIMALNFYNQKDSITLMNAWSKESKPFLFIVSYDREKNIILPLDKIDETEIKYDFGGVTNASPYNKIQTKQEVCFTRTPLSFEEFEKSFSRVVAGLKRGDSFLCNLTCETPVGCSVEPEELFYRTQARYKLWVKGQFVLFSPEIFVRIKDGIIRSYPMKGTIDASFPNAESYILSDVKESAEHATIVDLIRNDLSQIAYPVWVERYRYIDKLHTSNGEILQVSSEVCGKIDNINGSLGSVLFALLPAGSITGAPKPSTCRIIEEAETHDRNFYTGVCGIFDGEQVDSAVMIRFIEERNNGLYFKSGGGITTRSNAMSEYNELIQKVYVSVR